MDEDGDADSLSELYPCSLSCWMMQNLLHQETVANDRLSLSLPDTVLLQDGHMFHWLFTSSKSGSVVKRGTKKLEWDGLVKFLVRCSRKLDSRAPAEVIATARRLRDGRTYPVLLTARDIQSLREKHNAHLLDEIVAIQPFVLKNPFTECGLFETDFERKGVKRTSAATLATYELVRWPEEEVKWFGGVGSSGADSLTRPSGRAGEICAQQRRRKGSAKRVHGVVHRLLATTTKQIVEHVERETGEIILEVVAQFIFRPGSGQPTLLWLDSVHTLRSTQQSGNTTPAEIVDPDGEFLRLTRDLGETKSGRSWTTFFPPKIGDLVSGSGSLGFAEAGLSGESNRSRSEYIRSRTGRSVEAGMEPRAESNVTEGESSAAPVAPSDANEAAGEVSCSADGTREAVADDGISGAEEVGRVRNNGGPDGGYQRGRHFTLPTESWARRSAGRRGLYLSRTGGGGAPADQSLHDEWPRKRSTGTTMRRDCRRERLDLRSAAENALPWASPLTQAAKRGAGLPGSECGPVGVDGCYGDYCHYAGTYMTSHRTQTGSGGDPADGIAAPEDRSEASSGAEASRLIPFRSILKSRAEETALSSWSKSTQSSKLELKSSLRKGGCGGEPQHLPTLTGSDEKDLHLLQQVRRKGQLNLAALIAERMRLLAASLSDRGGGQYFCMGSSDRATAGPPEAAQRAIEELLYEKALSHLHPTTASRSVAACETCAMVYGYMDKFRRQTKQIKTASGQSTRAARIAVARQRRRQHERSRPHTVEAGGDGQGCASPLRRYSDLNLGLMPSRTARPATSDGRIG